MNLVANYPLNMKTSPSIHAKQRRDSIDKVEVDQIHGRVRKKKEQEIGLEKGHCTNKQWNLGAQKL